MPATNMWWAQTRNPKTAMAMLERAMNLYPKMRLREKQVMKQKRVSAESGVKDAKVEEALDGHKHDGDGDDRRAQDHDDASRVVRPHEQGETVPGQAGGAHTVNRDDEIQSGENRREPGNKGGESGL